MNKKTRLVGLFILDGWGLRARKHGNAIAQAKTPNFSHWLKTYERAVLDASGTAVGLPQDQMGNSEVGHLNLGGGRVVYQDITKINMAIEKDTLKNNPALTNLFSKLKSSHKKLHLIGLVSNGGVHSHINHLFALLDIATANNIQVVVHALTDGRDASPYSAEGFLKKLQDKLNALGNGAIATVSGRYFAMDRDKRWERTEKAYKAIFERDCELKAPSAVDAVKASHANDITDEFILPALIENKSKVTFDEGDGVLFFNFRADRMRQIVYALTDPNFSGFKRNYIGNKLNVVIMTEYDEGLNVSDIVFPYEIVKNPLAEVISKNGLKQLHSAETEKYPHVTYFFNGGRETPFEGEDRILVNSPKVATYDLQPEMSAYEVTEKVEKAIKENDYGFVLVNYANPDMVGHTGVLEAGIKAVETTDECVEKLVSAILAKGGVALVTADHGNCEVMINEKTKEPHTAHTTQPVNLVVISEEKYWLYPRGKLADVAPTVLDLMGLEKPQDMTGRSLIDR